MVILGVNSVYATQPCFLLPDYTDKLESYYENAKIGRDSCYPTFSFKTPAPYSKFGVSYLVSSHSFLYLHAETIQEYDTQLRNKITKIESCQYLPEYLKFATSDELSKLSIDYFLDEKEENCKDLSGIIESMEGEKIINDFLSSQTKFGDYSTCERSDSCGGMMCARSQSGSIKTGKISFYVSCDNNIKESLLLILDEDKVSEAYFQNSSSESYRKIYPEDVFIRERNPAWERMENATRNIILAAGGLITLSLVIGLVVFKKRKLFLRNK